MSAYEIVTAVSVSDANTTKSVTVSCPGGKRALGGGGDVGPSPASPNVSLQLSGPLAGGAGWQARASESDNISTPWTVSVIAICATVTP